MCIWWESDSTNISRINVAALGLERAALPRAKLEFHHPSVICHLPTQSHWNPSIPFRIIVLIT